MKQWMHAKNEKPKNMAAVLVRTKSGRYTTAFYDPNKEQWINDETDQEILGVTSWKEIKWPE